MHIKPRRDEYRYKAFNGSEGLKVVPKGSTDFKRNIQKVSPYPKLTQDKTEEPPRVLHAFNTYSEATCDRWQLCWKG